VEKRYLLIAAAIFVLSGCTYSEVHLDRDFGSAVRADIAAQIAFPEAHYAHNVEPASDGSRTALAQKRYQTNQVIQPSSITASSTSSVGNADNGAAGGAGNPSATSPATMQ
jgi:hypothetical protein